MKRISIKLIWILSCLIFPATLPVYAQNLLNKKPLQDFTQSLQSKLDKVEVDLTKPFSVTLEGYLTKEGRFNIKRSRFIKSEGDEDIVKVAKTAIEAVSDSGIFLYLENLGVEKALVNFSQNDKDVSVIINSELPTEAKAKTVASGFNMLFSIAKIKTKDDADVQTLLNASRINSEGKNFAINFILPKAEAHRLLKNELQKVKEKSYSS